MAAGMAVTVLPKVSLAHHTGAVTDIADVADMALTMAQFGIGKGPYPMLMHLVTCHHASPRRHTNWRTGSALAKHHALTGQTIQIGCNCHWITGVAHGVRSLLVGKNKNNIWLWHYSPEPAVPVSYAAP